MICGAAERTGLFNMEPVELGSPNALETIGSVQLAVCVFVYERGNKRAGGERLW